MTKFLMGAAAAAMVFGVAAANAQSSVPTKEKMAPAATTKVAPKKGTTTGSAESPRPSTVTPYDATPTNGTNFQQQPPEGRQGTRPSRGPNDPSVKPPG
jgi:hypothetical protein